MNILEVKKNGLHFEFLIAQGQEVCLLHVGTEKRAEDSSEKVRKQKWKEGKVRGGRIVEILLPGALNDSFRGSKKYYDTPQMPLIYERHEWTRNQYGEQLTIVQQGENVKVYTRYQLYDGIPVFTCESEIRNQGEEIWLDGITSFCYAGCAGEENTENKGRELEVYFARNTWSAECRWEHHSLCELGVIPYGNLCYDRFCIANSSGFSSGEFLPEGAIYNRKRDESLLWQIEHNGSWSVEIGCTIPDYGDSFLERDYRQDVYLEIFGPEAENAHWMKKIRTGEHFRTVPVTVAFAAGKPEEGMEQLTAYRRRIKKVTELPVIFNDYMNCFMGDSSTHKLLPYIEAAAEAGCEIFVIDCGWYDSGSWQFTFGVFEESGERYPGGLSEVMEAVRKAGMKPGLWLELESFGIKNKEAKRLPKNWLFLRNGKPVVDSGRYHLDFRNPAVRRHASEIVRKVVDRYGIKYLKIDYNLCSGLGTDLDSDSLGDGLLEHNRCYLEWIRQEKEKYPGIIWENCASGGLRMDYAMLRNMDIQSVSDQEDYKIMALIASNSASAVLPEQAGIWCYPRRENDRNAVIVNLVSAMLFRIHMGGHLAELSEDNFLLVKEGVACYKRIREEIAEGIPFWPIGFSCFDADWLCFGLHCQSRDFLAVIRRETETETLEISVRKDRKAASILYPADCTYGEVKEQPFGGRKMTIRIKEKNAACLLELI